MAVLNPVVILLVIHASGLITVPVTATPITTTPGLSPPAAPEFPCNTGISIPWNGGFECICPPNKQGKNCSEDVPNADECTWPGNENACSSSPCHGEDAVCINTFGGNYKCLCSPGSDGDRCGQGEYCFFCASKRWRNVTCPVFDDKPFLTSMTVQDVTLKTQVSRTRCTKNDKWNFDYRTGTMWVAKGCRGEFCVHFQDSTTTTTMPSTTTTTISSTNTTTMPSTTTTTMPSTTTTTTMPSTTTTTMPSTVTTTMPSTTTTTMPSTTTATMPSTVTTTMPSTTTTMMPSTTTTTMPSTTTTTMPSTVTTTMPSTTTTMMPSTTTTRMPSTTTTTSLPTNNTSDTPGSCDEFLVSGPNHSVPDSGLTASAEYSIYHGASRGRLDSTNEGKFKGGWTGVKEVDQWIQADLGELMLVNGVVTQGRWPYDGNSQWVTSFKISYSIDGSTYNFVENGNQDFEGNSDSETKVYNMFKAVQARYIRIIPTAWNVHISLRFDVIGCSITQ